MQESTSHTFRQRKLKNADPDTYNCPRRYIIFIKIYLLSCSCDAACREPIKMHWVFFSFRKKPFFCMCSLTETKIFSALSIRSEIKSVVPVSSNWVLPANWTRKQFVKHFDKSFTYIEQELALVQIPKWCQREHFSDVTWHVEILHTAIYSYGNPWARKGLYSPSYIWILMHRDLLYQKFWTSQAAKAKKFYHGLYHYRSYMLSWEQFLLRDSA